MKQERKSPTRAACLLFAAAALPFTPALAQNPNAAEPVTAPEVNLPDPVVTPPATQPPVTQTTPPAEPVNATPTSSATTPTPAAETPAPERRATTTRTARTTATRAAAPARTRAPARPAAEPPAAAPSTKAAPTAAPLAEPAAPQAAMPEAQPVTEPATGGGIPIWMWLVGGGLLLLLVFAALSMLRHRRRADAYEHDYEHGYTDEPVYARESVYPDEPAVTVHDESLAPVATGAAAVAVHEAIDRRSREPELILDDRYAREANMAPPAYASDTPATAEETVAVAEDVEVSQARADDVEALAASSAAPDGRPWLEFLMRPVRAGTSKDAAVVEFELTVGNTGDVPARDVRISTFMFAAGSNGESEMERMLIDRPSDAAVTERQIEPGDATRVEAAIALPREALGEEPVLPVVVADARYTLPDGREGRTRAAFEVGIPVEDRLEPFPTDRTSGLLESVEARLHGEPERV